MRSRELREPRQTRRWRALRRRVLDRDAWTCRRCGRPGRMEVHHKVPIGRGGEPFDQNNLEAVCRTCHIDLHRPPVTAEQQEWRDLAEELIFTSK
ncbi:MAG: HNH endonuclease [Spirochaetaceae bacterium]|nr:HNH endonuclease [Spirochaetaceae bacterium]